MLYLNLFSMKPCPTIWSQTTFFILRAALNVTRGLTARQLNMATERWSNRTTPASFIVSDSRQEITGPIGIHENTQWKPVVHFLSFVDFFQLPVWYVKAGSWTTDSDQAQQQRAEGALFGFFTCLPICHTGNPRHYFTLSCPFFLYVSAFCYSRLCGCQLTR